MKQATTILIIVLLSVQSSADFASDCLSAQNVYRSVLNITNLTWSTTIAQSAQAWANYLAAQETLLHSPASGYGENLACRTGQYIPDNTTSSTSTSSSSQSSSTTTNKSVSTSSSTNTVVNPSIASSSVNIKVNSTVSASIPSSTSTSVSVKPSTNTSVSLSSNTISNNSSSASKVGNQTVSSNTNNNVAVSNNASEPVNSNIINPVSSTQNTPSVPANNNSQNGDSQSTVNNQTKSGSFRPSLTPPPPSPPKVVPRNDGGSGDSVNGVNRRLDEFEEQDDQDLGRILSSTSLITSLVRQWGSEKNYFIYGVFPNVAVPNKTVGHYTQMIWNHTTEVGCGIANNDGGWVYFVCQYYPYGNMWGQLVY